MQFWNKYYRSAIYAFWYQIVVLIKPNSNKKTMVLLTSLKDF